LTTHFILDAVCDWDQHKSHVQYLCASQSYISDSDVLQMLILSWLILLNDLKQIGLYFLNRLAAIYFNHKALLTIELE